MKPSSPFGSLVISEKARMQLRDLECSTAYTRRYIVLRQSSWLRAIELVVPSFVRNSTSRLQFFYKYSNAHPEQVTKWLSATTDLKGQMRMYKVTRLAFEKCWLHQVQWYTFTAKRVFLLTSDFMRDDQDERLQPLT